MVITGEKATSWRYKLTVALVAVTFLSGFINLIPLPGVFPATLIIDGLYVLMFFVFLGLVAETKGHLPFPPWAVCMVMLTLTFVALIPKSEEPLGAILLDLRSLVLYAFIAVFVALALTREELVRLLNLAMQLSIGLAVFGIIQFVLRDQLPEFLLKPKDADIFGYFGTDIVRSNGLIGNTIVYGNVLLLFFALHASRWIAAPRLSLKGAIPSVILFAAILTTFSRAAIGGAAVAGVLILIAFAFRKGTTKTVVFLVISGWAAITGWLVVLISDDLMNVVTDSFIYRGLFMGQNASVQGSNQGHQADINLALDIMGNHPWTGLGLHTQSQNSINAQGSNVITDGAIWRTLAEGGFLLSAAYVALIVASVIVMWRAMRVMKTDNYAAIGLLMFSIYEFGFAAIYNSSFFGKPSFILFWILFGIIAGIKLRDEPPKTAVVSDKYRMRLHDLGVHAEAPPAK